MLKVASDQPSSIGAWELTRWRHQPRWMRVSEEDISPPANVYAMWHHAGNWLTTHTSDMRGSNGYSGSVELPGDPDGFREKTPLAPMAAKTMLRRNSKQPRQRHYKRPTPTAGTSTSSSSSSWTGCMLPLAKCSRTISNPSSFSTTRCVYCNLNSLHVGMS